MGGHTVMRPGHTGTHGGHTETRFGHTRTLLFMFPSLFADKFL